MLGTERKQSLSFWISDFSQCLNTVASKLFWPWPLGKKKLYIIICYTYYTLVANICFTKQYLLLLCIYFDIFSIWLHFYLINWWSRPTTLIFGTHLWDPLHFTAWKILVEQASYCFGFLLSYKSRNRHSPNLSVTSVSSFCTMGLRSVLGRTTWVHLLWFSSKMLGKLQSLLETESHCSSWSQLPLGLLSYRPCLRTLPAATWRRICWGITVPWGPSSSLSVRPASWRPDPSATRALETALRLLKLVPRGLRSDSGQVRMRLIMGHSQTDGHRAWGGGLSRKPWQSSSQWK